MRLDRFIFDQFDCPSRTYAENLVLTGKVKVNSKIVLKPAYKVEDSDIVELVSNDGYASQGAYKLVKALDEFNISISGKLCADIGCSNGGFTDVLLRHDAKSVLAIDVGECVLEQSLLNSGKVTFLRANARNLPKVEKVDFVCADVSFISLRHILPSIYSLLKESGDGVVLVKPQFELVKSALGKKGIVLKEKDRVRALETVEGYAKDCGFVVVGRTQSPILFENKNIEYLLHLKMTDKTNITD